MEIPSEITKVESKLRLDALAAANSVKASEVSMATWIKAHKAQTMGVVVFVLSIALTMVLALR
jgi:hypothetical protein